MPHAELHNMATGFFGNMVKAVVDIEPEIVAIDAEPHSDLEVFLLENESRRLSQRGSASEH